MFTNLKAGFLQNLPLFPTLHFFHLFTIYTHQNEHSIIIQTLVFPLYSPTFFLFIYFSTQVMGNEYITLINKLYFLISQPCGIAHFDIPNICAFTRLLYKLKHSTLCFFFLSFFICTCSYFT